MSHVLAVKMTWCIAFFTVNQKIIFLVLHIFLYVLRSHLDHLLFYEINIVCFNSLMRVKIWSPWNAAGSENKWNVNEMKKAALNVITLRLKQTDYIHPMIKLTKFTLWLDECKIQFINEIFSSWKIHQM